MKSDKRVKPQPKLNKTKPEKAKKQKNLLRRTFGRSLGALVILIVCLLGLLIQVGYWQIARGVEIKNRQYAQSTANSVIAAKRGRIYDSNGKALAISAQVDTITVNPSYIGYDKNEDEKVGIREKLATKFSELV